MTTAERMIGLRLAGVYLLEDVIASGSTSIIYRAINERLDQPVAVKVLYGSFTDNASLMARFEIEAKVQAKLNHPHIVKVFDFVADADTYAIVMELVEGVVLDQLLYDLAEPMELGRVRNLLDPILDALDFAHERGIVHRDVKPSNIIVSDVGGRDYPLIMDFGIAKVLAEGPSQTAPGAMLGTLLFMSPEQCKALKTVDKRADVYSIGVTLYQMTTGMVPFYADSAFEIMLAHVQTPPTPPREFVPDMPAELEALILRALEKEPEDRFSSVRELRDALAVVADTYAFSGTGSAASGRRLSRQEAAAYSSEHRSIPVSDEYRVPSLDSAVLSAPAGFGRSDLSYQTGPRQPAPLPDPVPTRSPASSRLVQEPPDKSNLPVKKGAPTRQGLPVVRQGVPARQGGEYSALSERVVASRAPAEGAGERAPTRGDQLDVPRERIDGRRAKARRPTSATHSLQQRAEMAATGPAEPPPTNRLRLRIPSKGDWVRFFDPNIAGGGIFCPSTEPPPVGTAVRLEIVFVKGPRFFVRGAVTWRRPQLNDPRARAGVGLQVHPSERNKLAYVNNWVHGQVDDKRLLRRLPVKLHVTYSARSGRRINFTRDLNEQGLFLRSRELLDLETPISVTLMPPGSQMPFQLHGRVSRLVEDPEDRGMGIRLEFSDESQQQTYAAFVQRLEQEFLSGALPDDALT